MRIGLTLLISILSLTGCSEATGPSNTHALDAVFPGEWRGSYPLGHLTLRVARASSGSFASFEGSATFAVTETGETVTYRFSSFGHAESFSFLLYPDGAIDQFPGGSGSLASADTLILHWDEPLSGTHRSIMGKAERVILSR